MSEEEILEILRTRLRLEMHIDSVYTGSVRLMLDDECISEVTID